MALVYKCDMCGKTMKAPFMILLAYKTNKAGQELERRHDLCTDCYNAFKDMKTVPVINEGGPKV